MRGSWQLAWRSFEGRRLSRMVKSSSSATSQAIAGIFSDQLPLISTERWPSAEAGATHETQRRADDSIHVGGGAYAADHYGGDPLRVGSAEPTSAAGHEQLDRTGEHLAEE